VVPAVNQIELHPRFQQRALRAFHAEHGIVTESWSPLAQGKLVGDPTIETIARKHGRTTAQVRRIFRARRLVTGILCILVSHLQIPADSVIFFTDL